MNGEELQLAETEARDGGEAVGGGETAQTIGPERLEGLKLRGGRDEATASLLDRRLDAAGHCVQQRIVVCHAGFIRERMSGRQS
jgi:hypothetical protein